MPFCDQMFAFMINESANWDVVHLLQSITHQIRQMSWLSRRCRIAKAIYICFYETGHYCSSSFQTTHLFCKFNIRHDALVLISPYLRGPLKGLPILSDNVHLWYLNILACCYKSQLLNPICTSHTTTSATGHHDIVHLHLLHPDGDPDHPTNSGASNLHHDSYFIIRFVRPASSIYLLSIWRHNSVHLFVTR